MYPPLSFIIYNFKKLENISEIKLYDQIFSELITHCDRNIQLFFTLKCYNLLNHTHLKFLFNFIAY